MCSKMHAGVQDSMTFLPLAMTPWSGYDAPPALVSCYNSPQLCQSKGFKPAGVVPGAKEYDDVIVAPAMEGPAMNFMYQYSPQVGVLPIYASNTCQLVL